VPLARRAEVRHRSAAARAIAEIVADDDVRRMQLADDQPLCELVGADVANGAEARAQQLVDAERSEPLETFAETREPRRRIVRGKEFLRRRLERKHEAAFAGGVRLGARTRENRFVARVQTVEHADRDHAGRRRRLERRDVAIEPHAETQPSA
jgi:hypothetical protein